MKHGKLFAKIVYYLFTFTIGILLAVFLPYILMSDGEHLNMMEDSLDKGNYSDAMMSVGGYFDKEPIFSLKFEEGGGIVLFSAATLVYSEDEETIDESKIHKAYAGFLYGVKDRYSVTAESKNQTKVIVENGAGETHTVTLLDGDLNDDKVCDTVTTYYTNGFLFLDFDEDTHSSLRKLTFIDKDGQTFKEIALTLDYQEQFFTDVNDFLEEYNRDFKSENLPALDQAFLEKSENYAKSSLSIVRSRADIKAAVVVVVYFVCVYVIADFLLGYHFIIRFFRWFIYKVCKVKPRKGKKINKKEVFGADYFCQVTFEADVSAVEDFSESVQIRYTGEKGEEISFLLLKQDEYKTIVRIKAGIYVNMWIDLDKTEYVTQDLPETLEVEGYHKTFRIKILKREIKRDENFNSTSD